MRVSYTNPVPIADEAFNTFFGKGRCLALPSLLIWSVLVVAIGQVILRCISFDRQSRSAARSPRPVTDA